MENNGSLKFLRGQGLSKEDITHDGKYKCVLYGELYTKYKKAIIDEILSRTNVKTRVLSEKGDVLVPATTTADALGIAIGRAISENSVQIGGDINILRTGNKEILAKYLAELFCTILKETLAQYATGTNILHLSNENIRNIRIPLPPLDIQQSIVDGIEEIDKKNNKAQEKIYTHKQEIDKLLKGLYNKSANKIRLSDINIFNLSIGKRVLNSDLNAGGKIPVYSANVFEPFGYIDKFLINDFDKPSVLWGIDGDWMTNIISENIPFYPTDHCGVIKLLKNNIIKEKYLAYALYIEGKAFGFSRSKRASIDRISGITIPLPTFSEQQKIVSKIDELEKQITEAQAIIDNSKNQKQTVLDKYLK